MSLLVSRELQLPSNIRFAHHRGEVNSSSYMRQGTRNIADLRV